MVRFSLSSPSASPLGQTASRVVALPPLLLKLVPARKLKPAQEEPRMPEIEALASLQQIFRKHFPVQSQHIQQHQDTIHNALTVLVPIQASSQDSLQQILADTAAINPFFSQSASTHFARFVVLKDESQGIDEPHLLFSATYDGHFEDYIRELFRLTDPDCLETNILNRIFQSCRAYPTDASRDVETFSTFIRQHSIKHNTFFMAYWNRSVAEIYESKAFCDELQQAIEAPALRQEIDEVWAHHCLKHHIKPQKPTLLIPTAFTKFFEQFLEKYWVKIRFDQNDPSDRLQQTAAQVERLRASRAIEDQMAQNQFLTLHAIHPGFLGINALILKFLLYLAAGRARKAKGNLSGISTIHSLRWVIIPKGILSRAHVPYLLFESNYNGSWDSYVDDFVQYAYHRMNLIWGKCTNYRSRGAQDTEWFKQHIRNYLFPAQAYYSAYPDLSVHNIITSLRVAEVLKINLSDPQQAEVSAEPSKARQVLDSFRLFLAGAYQSIN